MSNLASTSDIKKEVLRRSGEKDDGTSEFEDRVLDYINYWYHSVLAGSTELDVECGEPWYWARAQFPGVVNLDPYYISNACSLSYGSVNGTLQSIPLDQAGNQFSLEGWLIKLSGGSEYYRVVSHAAGSTSFQIDSQFNDSNVTMQNFTAYHLEYQLMQGNGIIRLAAPMRVYRRQSPYADDTGQVDIIDKMSLDRDYPLFRILQGVPDRAAITYTSTEGGIWVRFNRVPAYTTRCEYEYIPEADSLTDSAKSIPIIPHEHRSMLVYGAVYNLLIDKNDNRATEYRDLCTRSLMAMVQANRRIKANMQKDMGRLIPRRDMTHYTRRYYAQEVSQ